MAHGIRALYPHGLNKGFGSIFQHILPEEDITAATWGI